MHPAARAITLLFHSSMSILFFFFLVLASLRIMRSGISLSREILGPLLAIEWFKIRTKNTERAVLQYRAGTGLARFFWSLPKSFGGSSVFCPNVLPTITIFHGFNS